MIYTYFRRIAVIAILYLANRIGQLSLTVIVFYAFILPHAISQNTDSTRNPWGMLQGQYGLFENESVSQINSRTGVHPTYGALSLPEVSFISNNHDNGGLSLIHI